jgi:hypothetical protein
MYYNAILNNFADLGCRYSRLGAQNILESVFKECGAKRGQLASSE